MTERMLIIDDEEIVLESCRRIFTAEGFDVTITTSPQEGLRLVSELTGQSMVDLFGAATFYHSFSLEPQGRHLVSVCQGTACHVRGAPAVARELSRQLKIQPGETTEDGEFSLQTARCLGACSLGPVAVVDGIEHWCAVHGNLKYQAVG